MEFKLLGNYFEGQFSLTPLSGRNAADLSFKRYCPADLDQLLWECPVDYKHVDLVAESSVKGFQTWKKTTLSERVNFLKRYQEVVITRRDDLVQSIIFETGKSFLEANEEVSLTINKVDVAVTDVIKRISSIEIEHLDQGETATIQKLPISPTLIISAGNLPAHMPNGEMVASLLAGSSIILKPSEKGAHTAQILFECFHQAEFPAGVVNLIHGDHELTRRMVKAKPIKVIYFTGTKEVGQKILSYASEDITKTVSLALGSKNTCIISSSANLEKAVNESLIGCFKTTGQRCTSTSIIAVHNTLLEEFISKFHGLSKELTIGHPNDKPAPYMGPLLDEKILENYLLYVGMAKREGLEEIMRGKMLERPTRGNYVSPAIHLAQKYDESSLFLKTEIFGPDCTIIPYSTPEEAVHIANSGEYGLTNSLYSTDNAEIDFIARELNCGQVNINLPTTVVNSRLPFSGIKGSGNYHPGGIATIDHCVFTKTILKS